MVAGQPGEPSPRVRNVVADLVRTPLRWSHEDLLHNIDEVERRCRSGEFDGYSSEELNWLLVRTRRAQRTYSRREKRLTAALTACGAALGFFGTSTFFNFPSHVKYTLAALFIPLAWAAYLFHQMRHEHELVNAALERLHVAFAGALPQRVRVDAAPTSPHHEEAEREPDTEHKRRER